MDSGSGKGRTLLVRPWSSLVQNYATHVWQHCTHVLLLGLDLDLATSNGHLEIVKLMLGLSGCSSHSTKDPPRCDL